MWKILIGENNNVNVLSHITLAGNYIFLNQYAPLIPHIFPSASYMLYVVSCTIEGGGGGGATFNTPIIQMRVIRVNILYDIYSFGTHVTRD